MWVKDHQHSRGQTSLEWCLHQGVRAMIWLTWKGIWRCIVPQASSSCLSFHCISGTYAVPKRSIASRLTIFPSQRCSTWSMQASDPACRSPRLVALRGLLFWVSWVLFTNGWVLMLVLPMWVLRWHAVATLILHLVPPLVFVITILVCTSSCIDGVMSVSILAHTMVDRVLWLVLRSWSPPLSLEWSWALVFHRGND